METLTISSAEEGVNLHATYWPSLAPSPPPSALLFLAHGFSEHLGMYDRFARAIRERHDNLLVFGHDHRGHGRSEGKRAYVEDVGEEYATDVIMHCQSLKSRFPSVPLYLLGHSMGGMVAIEAVLAAPKDFFQGLGLQGALVIPGFDILGGAVDFRVTRARSLVVSPFLRLLDLWDPELVLGHGNLDLVTTCDAEKKRLAEDKLRWSKGCKVRLLLAFVRCLESHLTRLEEISLPLLVLHGEKDTVCNPEGSRLLYRHARSIDKELHEFEGAVHQLYLEREEVRDAATDKTAKWLEKRMAEWTPPTE